MAMIILSCPQMTTLAQRLAGLHQEFRLSSIQWDTFSDGFPKLKIHNTDALRNQDVCFLASFDSPGEIFRQLSAIYELPRYGVKSFKLVLPYFPTGTMERIDEDGQVATAATLAKMLSQIPMTMTGPAQILIFDIHALQERFYFSDQVTPRLETAVPLLHDRLERLANVAVAFPDDGAAKRFARFFPDLPHIVCQKVRQEDRRVVTIRDGDPRGLHVVIVDDLVMTGGTLLQCQKTLIRAGADRISAFAVHGVFPQMSHQRFTPQDFDTFWTTDSCPVTAERIKDKAPFEVLSLARPLVELLAPDEY